MDALVKEQIRRWKAAIDADNERALEEKRCRTPAERLRLLQAFLDGHGNIVLQPNAAVDEDRERVLEEIRRRTSAERLAILQRKLEEHVRLGLPFPEPEPHHIPYHEVQERMMRWHEERSNSRDK